MHLLFTVSRRSYHRSLHESELITIRVMHSAVLLHFLTRWLQDLTAIESVHRRQMIDFAVVQIESTGSLWPGLLVF